MRIAIDTSTEVGKRAARILLAERDVEEMAVIDGPSGSSTDSRVTPAGTDLTGYDVVATADPAPESLVAKAREAGIAIAVWIDEPEDEAPVDESTVLWGANLASGIATCLVAHEAAVVTDHEELSVAWTEPGSPLRRGVPIPFPRPVGPTWATVRSESEGLTELAAPVEGEWAGALARVTGPSGTNIVGVADLAVHLEALSLAAGVACLGRGAFNGGRHRPEDSPERYLLTAMEMGLDVASYRE